MNYLILSQIHSIGFSRLPNTYTVRAIPCEHDVISTELVLS